MSTAQAALPSSLPIATSSNMTAMLGWMQKNFSRSMRLTTTMSLEHLSAILAHGWRQFWRMSFGEVGFLRKMLRPWFSYFRPGFHPWDHDNSHLLEGIEAFSQRWEQKALPNTSH